MLQYWSMELVVGFEVGLVEECLKSTNMNTFFVIVGIGRKPVIEPIITKYIKVNNYIITMYI